VANGTPGTVNRVIVETKQTQPPKRYTEATLLADMESIAKFVTDPAKKAMLKADPELGKQGGIGTEATRAEILGTLIARRGFIKNDKKNLVSTPSGRRLIENRRGSSAGAGRSGGDYSMGGRALSDR